MPATQPTSPGVLLFERPDWGVIAVMGGDRASFLHNLTTNDVKSLQSGQGTSAVLVNQRGGILDWLDLYATDDAILVITGPDRAQADLAWLDKYLILESVELKDLSAGTTFFYLTGPQASAVLGKLAPETAGLSAYGHLKVEIDGLAVAVLKTAGLLGEGFHLLCDASVGPQLKDRLLNAGAVSCDAIDFEFFRIESGMPLVGHELLEARNPWEARLDLSLSLSKGCYLGQEIIARLDAYHKIQRYLMGLDLPAGELPKAQAPLFAEGREVGFVTSAVRLPDGRQLGLGYVRGSHAIEGTQLWLAPDAQGAPAVARDRPFWAGKTRQAVPMGAV